MIAEARVHTGHATRYLSALCGQLEAKAQSDPDLGVRVAWTETDGTIDFAWGRCVLSADASGLTLRAEAADDDGLRHVRELISRHLDKHAGEEALELTWFRDGKPIADTHAGRRDAMRGFHRRMRH